MSANQPDGISVILATCRGAGRIGRALNSLARQTLAPERFEVVVSVNGPDDGTTAVVERFAAAHPAMNIVVTASPQASVSRARNIALELARMGYFTVLDDDDWVSPEYLGALLERCAPGRVATTFVCDVPVDGPRTFSHYLGEAVARWAGRTMPATELPSLTSANGGKAAPTQLGRRALFPPQVSSGEDVVFWSRLVTQRVRQVAVLPIHARAFYYRHVRSASVSRRSDDQWVEDRLVVIAELKTLSADFPAWAQRFAFAVYGQCVSLGQAAAARPELLDDLSARLEPLATHHQFEAFWRAARPEAR
ncbi:MAG: glycosyltransferase [Propionibacteriaceae bacterium]|jgi:glycosyltransferase involved in cell wall biosynthesis|nr:glycosyltransferase [Propionibacteriaceae bacterium]